MEIKTYDTILTELCDGFDSLISPRKISRSNANIIYLLLKAFAKGAEVISNLVLSLSNKFNPEKCTDEDLVSVAKLVGTHKLEGSATGLAIVFNNELKKSIILPAGTYTYTLDEDSIFSFVQTIDETILQGDSVTKIAVSTELRSIPVTQQDKINIVGTKADGTPIDLFGFNISCEDNSGLQGTEPETNLEFRNRVLRGYSTASIFDRMREEISNLPYIFDCQLVFNNTASPLVFDNITPETPVSIPGYHLLVIVSGKPDKKVAEIVASYGTYETAVIPKLDKVIQYENNVFIDGAYDVHYIEPLTYTYDLNVYYEADSKAISTASVEKAINAALKRYKHTNVYTPLLTEREFSNYLASLGLTSVQILNVDLVDKMNSSKVKDYIKVPRTRIAKLGEVHLNNMSEV